MYHVINKADPDPVLSMLWYIIDVRPKVCLPIMQWTNIDATKISTSGRPEAQKAGVTRICNRTSLVFPKWRRSPERRYFLKAEKYTPSKHKQALKSEQHGSTGPWKTGHSRHPPPVRKAITKKVTLLKVVPYKGYS